MNYEPWTDQQKQQLQAAVDAGLRPFEINALFPTRTPAAVSTKIKYEAYKAEINANRAAGRGHDAPPISDADAVTADMDNQRQDALFQIAMQAAIDAGLEMMPRAAAPYSEFRPVNFDRQAGMSFGRSPALLCAELGAL